MPNSATATNKIDWLSQIISALTNAGILFSVNTIESLAASATVQNGTDPTKAKEYGQAFAAGTRVVEVADGALGLPGTLIGNQVVTSYLIPTFDVPHLYCRVKLTQNGTLILNRYSDLGGLWLESSSTASITANVTCSIDVTSAGFSRSAQLSITNGTASGATLTSPVLSLSL